ncbi:alpha/beta fold hydrolase [Herbiconiux sp. P18]|uniref:alpha/beta fold hydrolase n=1 Tax=Herbiconiux liangxiaofengii TaxID=3342795 RepID=UPI0035BB7EBC
MTDSRTITVGDVDIAFETAGDPAAPAVLLVHGFASNRSDNWVRTRWLPPLVDAGFRVIAPDLRGHGESGRPRRLAAYTLPRLLGDLTAVLDATDARVAHVVGYSLGARLAWELAVRRPERVASLVVGGAPVLGSFAGFDLPAATAALRGSAATPPATARYLTMATRGANDPEALLRVAEAVRRSAFDPRATRPAHPLLVVAGDDDEVAAESRALAHELGARFVGLPGRDHVSAVTSRVFKAEVVEFLQAEQARRATGPATTS